MPEFKGLNLVLPEEDAEFRPYFAAAAQGALVLAHCLDCQRCRFPPGLACPWCSSLNYDWRAVSGKGSVYSYVVVTHPIQRGFAADVPYIGALIELDFQRDEPQRDESIRIASNLVDEAYRPVPESAVAINARVDVVFQPIAEGLALPLWRLTGDASERPLWQLPG